MSPQNHWTPNYYHQVVQSIDLSMYINRHFIMFVRVPLHGFSSIVQRRTFCTYIMCITAIIWFLDGSLYALYIFIIYVCSMYIVYNITAVNIHLCDNYNFHYLAWSDTIRQLDSIIWFISFYCKNQWYCIPSRKPNSIPMQNDRP